MKTLLFDLRQLQFVAHQYHLTVRGLTFLEHHEFLGELYLAYERAFDALAERALCANVIQPNDISDITSQAATNAKSYSVMISHMDMFRTLERLENSFLTDMEAEPDLSLGTSNLYATLADESEARLYKLGQLTS